MARMLPPYCSTDVKSSAERRVFGMLRDDPGATDWTCLHSLGLARHVTRRYGEIDFVVLVPGEGIFCLEVKGGRVTCLDGQWTFTNRYGEGATRARGPFMQARDGMFSLVGAVKRRFGEHHRLPNLLFGYGVLFPDIAWDHDDPEHEPWQVYDRDFRLPISAFIRQLARSSHAARGTDRWADPDSARPTAADIKELVSFLRGDFEVVSRPGERLAELDAELLRLTQEQYRLLDALNGNDRLLVHGAAGTGKTLLAMEFARRESLTGQRVLLLCFNRLLGRWISRAGSASGLPPAVTVRSFHQFLDEIIGLSSRRAEFAARREEVSRTDDGGEFFREEYPLFALDAIGEGVMDQFGVIILDEGQDLIRSEFLDVLDSLLAGGMAGGRWAIFCDLHRQAIYAGTAPGEMEAEVERRSPRYARLRLTVNCRNTRPIGEETALLSGFDASPFLPSSIDGTPVDYRFYTDAREQRQAIASTVSKLANEGLTPEQITILSPVTRQRSCLARPIENLPWPLADLADTGEPYVKGAVAFSTIQAFKGLESTAVIVADVERIQSGPYPSLLYVAMSRARQRLSVMLARSAREEYAAAIRRRLEKEIEKP